MNRIKWLLHSIRRSLILSFAAVLIFYLVSDIGLLVLPLLYAQILNITEGTKSFPELLFFLLLGFTILLLSLRSYAGYLNSKQQVEIHKNICLSIIKRLFSISPYKVAKNGSKYYADMVLNRSLEISSLFDIKAMTGVINLIRLIVITAIIFFIDKTIGVASTILIIISFYIYKYGNEYYIRNKKDFIEKKMGYLSGVEDTIVNKEEVHVLKAFSYEKNRNNLSTENLRKIATKILSMDFIHFFIELDFVRIFYELFVFAWSLYRVYAGYYQIGTGIVLISYSTMITGPIVYLNSILSNIKNSLSSIDIIRSLEEKNKAVAIAPDEEIKEILFDEVNYSVNDREIFRSLSFKIKKGEKVAILGQSGKGKSTIVSLILKDIALSSGNIFINGHDINSISKDWLYRHIAVLSQTSTLFSDTIEENIRLGNNLFNRKNLEEILHKVRLPLKLDYKIEENATNVSQGEKERILLARIIAHGKDKDFIILDEPFEGLDIKTRNEILIFLKEYLKNKTVCIITHRDAISKILSEKTIRI